MKIKSLKKLVFAVAAVASGVASAAASCIEFASEVKSHMDEIQHVADSFPECHHDSYEHDAYDGEE